MWVQKVPGGGVTSLAFAPDGRTLYVLDGWTVTAWDTTARTGTPVFQVSPNELRRANSLRATADGQFLVQLWLQGGVVWNLEAGKPARQLPKAILVHSVVPDRAAPRVWAIGRRRVAVESWNLDTGTPGPSLVGWPAGVALTGFDTHPHAPVVVLVGLRGADEPPGAFETRLTVFEHAAGAVLGDYHTAVFGAYRPRFSPDGGTFVVVGDHLVELWATAPWAVRLPAVRCESPYQVFDFHPHAPVFVALNPDRALTLFSLETGRPIRTYDFALGRQVNCVAFAPDGLTCAAGGSNKRFVVFDVDL